MYSRPRTIFQSAGKFGETFDGHPKLATFVGFPLGNMGDFGHFIVG